MFGVGVRRVVRVRRVLEDLGDELPLELGELGERFRELSGCSIEVGGDFLAAGREVQVAEGLWLVRYSKAVARVVCGRSAYRAGLRYLTLLRDEASGAEYVASYEVERVSKDKQ